MHGNLVNGLKKNCKNTDQASAALVMDLKQRGMLEDELGEFDELGFNATVDRVHLHGLHATLPHLMGFDHKKLTYRFQGRDFRLTDIHGEIVDKLLP